MRCQHHFMLMCCQVKKENTDASFGEIGKLLGKKWKEISASDKTKYEEMANKDKVRVQSTRCGSAHYPSPSMRESSACKAVFGVHAQPPCSADGQQKL